MSTSIVTNTDEEMDKYEEAALLMENPPPLNNNSQLKKTVYNGLTGKNDVLLPLSSGGYVKIAEQERDRKQDIIRYATDLQNMNQPFNMDDFTAAGYAEDEVQAAGVVPQGQVKSGRSEPLSEAETIMFRRSGSDVAMPPNAMSLPVVEPWGDDVITEVTKGLVRGGLTKPAEFLKDNFGIYDPLVLQLVNPKTGEFDPAIKILSREEKEQLDADMAAGIMPYAFDFEQLVEANPDAGIGATMSGGMAQFLGAFAGIGKLFRVGSGMTAGFTQGAAADFLAFSGDEGRITDLLLEMGVPENQVTNFLKTDPNDPDYVGRFKTALEGGPIGVLLEGTLLTIGKTFRAIKDGDVPPEVLDETIKEGKQSLLGVVQNKLESLGAEADERIAAEGATLYSNPVGPISDRILSALGRMVAKTQSDVRAEGGLPIAQDKGDENLRLHSQRIAKMREEGVAYPGAPKNPRTVIKAPEGSDLPDVVVGNIEPEDWQQRIEASMSPEEINKAASWYKIVFGEFQKQADGDPEEIARLTDAWFAGQQNSSPSQTLNDVLYIYEQVKRGVPKDEIVGKGLPSANRLVIDILTQSEITAGAGQKIADFLDAGYGKNVRAIMGNNPEGGSPFVVDIHTARDTGLVDQIYINHLTRLGYDVPDNLIVDVGGGGIKGPMYENRAMFGHQLTDHLNQQNWMGRSDWEPAEIQAIGWMQLSNMYGGSNTGGDIVDAFSVNTRRISMEVDPGEGSPLADKFGEDYKALSVEDQRAINDQVTSKAIELVNNDMGITLGSNVHGTGGWELFQNPSTVQQAIASKQAAIEAGARLGFYLQQTEVWVNAPKPITKNPQNFSIDILEDGSETLRDSNKLRTLFEALIEAEPRGLIRGYQPVVIDGKPGIRVIVTKDTIASAAKEARKAGEKVKQSDLVQYVQDFANNELEQVLEQVDIYAQVDIMESDLTILGNDWKVDKDGKGYKGYFSGQSGQDASTENAVPGLLDSNGAQLEKLFGDLINEAKRRQQQ